MNKANWKMAFTFSSLLSYSEYTKRTNENSCKSKALLISGGLFYSQQSSCMC